MSVKFEVTLKELRKEGACFGGYNKVVRLLQGAPFSLEDGERESYIRFAHKDQISLLSILESNGLDDALWALRCVPGVDRDARLFAVWCARQVQYLMGDARLVNALDVAERFADGAATSEELDAARSDARSAAWSDARSAAWSDARSAAWSAARSAAWRAAQDAAQDAARSAARSAAQDAARSAQKEMFILMCNGKAPWQKGAA